MTGAVLSSCFRSNGAVLTDVGVTNGDKFCLSCVACLDEAPVSHSQTMTPRPDRQSGSRKRGKRGIKAEDKGISYKVDTIVSPCHRVTAALTALFHVRSQAAGVLAGVCVHECHTAFVRMQCLSCFVSISMECMQRDESQDTHGVSVAG